MPKKVFTYYFLLIFFFSCEENYTPKPKGFNRIDLPRASYQSIGADYPYQFEYSTLVNIEKDTSEDYWINLNYKDFDAVVQLTYKDLTDPKNEAEIIMNEAFELTKKHMVKAYSIEESLIGMKNGQVASVAELEGEVPTQFQFYTSDTSNHFFRGALYFNTALKNDSLAPIIEFIKKDMVHMLNTFEWKY